MRIEQLLYEYPYIVCRLEDIKRLINDLHVQKQGEREGLRCPLSRFGEAPLAAGRVGDPTGQAAIIAIDHIGDKLHRLDIERRQLHETIQQVQAMLSVLTQQEAKIIELHYFERRRSRDISNIMECSKQNCHHHKTKALKKMGDTQIKTRF